MNADFGITFLASLLAAGITSLGIMVIRRHAAWGHRNSSYFATFAAGVLISVSFLHLTPTALAAAKAAPIWLMLGYFALYAINRFAAAHVCDRESLADSSLGLVPLIGIGFHSFVDGMIYSVTFSVDIFTGSLAALGMVLHEFPEGIVTYLLLRRGGFQDRGAAIGAFAAAALTTPLGTLASYPWVAQLQGPVLGLLLALSAGALIYVGATHLLPAAEREGRKYRLLALAAGIVLALTMMAVKP
ncbi:MAG: hypothetical protein Tsb0016_08670 [Sphingomonadales bacterium]